MFFVEIFEFLILNFELFVISLHPILIVNRKSTYDSPVN